jgi:hypothetical protein
MSFGVIEYNQNGLPKCEICGQFFDRVLSHVRQKHAMTAREYKEMYGFDLIKGITSLQSKLKSREAVLNNYERVVARNLLEKGKDSRFKEGCKGRTVEQVSPQTRLMLGERAKNSMTPETRKQRGKVIGLSGEGNLARWGI